MAANPYITIPAGNINQQNMLIQAYYRNLALQNQYAQQQYQYDQQGHQWENALALGVGKGIGSGFDQYLGAVDQTAKFNQQNQLQMFSDVNQATRQHDLFAQQDAAQTEREQAQAEQQQRAALFAQQAEQRKATNLGLGYQSILGAMVPQEVPQPDQWQPPADYNDVSQSVPQPSKWVTPSVEQAIRGQDPALVGLVMSSPGMLENILKMQGKSGGFTEPESMARLKEAQDFANRGDMAGAQRLLQGTPFAGMTLTAKPPTPEKMPFTDTYNQFLSAQGYTREQYDALPPERKDAIRQSSNVEADKRAATLRRLEIEASQAVIDTRERAKEADAATRDFTTLRVMVPQIQQAAQKLLMPGFSGKVMGMAKETLQTLAGTYPEAQELLTMGTAVQGAVARRVLLEVGMLTEFDVGRAKALIPQVSDNLETGMAKLRVLQLYLDASLQAWDAYRQSGLLGSGRPAAKTVNDFLPSNFWQQAQHLAPDAPPPGFKRVTP